MMLRRWVPLPVFVALTIGSLFTPIWATALMWVLGVGIWAVGITAPGPNDPR